MSDKTGISWTDATWNPVVGCSVISPACTNCYAMAQAARIVRMENGALRSTHYEGTTQASKAGPVWTGKLNAAPDEIWMRPLRWKRPRRIFVNSMSDLFHEAVPDAWIDRVFAIMALAPQHTFQVLTKRPERMRNYLSRGAWNSFMAWSQAFEPGTCRMTQHEIEAWLDPITSDEHRALYRAKQPLWPLPNVWLGVTAEDQTRADERIPHLLATPAAVRFVSVEPMLGPVDLTAVDLIPFLDKGRPRHEYDPVCTFNSLSGRTNVHPLHGVGDPFEYGLDWVICGGESGQNVRPMATEWAESLKAQCEASVVAFFMKQMSGKTKREREAIPEHLMVKEFP